MAKKKAKDEVVDPLEIDLQLVVVEFAVLGVTPLIMNRLSEKARRILLFPPPKKNRVERAMTLKHEPLEEYRMSVYRARGNDAPTRLLLPSGAFKKAMATVAVDLPGATKAEMGRLTSVPMVDVHVYGVPQIFCSVVRQAGINRTPDIRTRAILPEWACWVKVGFMSPLLKETGVAKLLAAAGAIIGVGDWRSEKGSGNFGSFTIVPPDDPGFLRVIKCGGLAEQDAALAEPVAYDCETEDLLAWFDDELTRRDETSKMSANGRLHSAATVSDTDEDEEEDDDE